MKTLTNLTATCTESQPIAAETNAIANTQSRQGFWRRVRYAKSGSYFETSTGASVFLSLDEQFKLVEANEPLFIQPTESPKT
jgi:rhamnogalacturonyl hydrolase YesR